MRGLVHRREEGGLRHAEQQIRQEVLLAEAYKTPSTRDMLRLLAGKVAAKFDNGVLTITMEKREASTPKQGRSIPING